VDALDPANTRVWFQLNGSATIRSATFEVGSLQQTGSNLSGNFSFGLDQGALPEGESTIRLSAYIGQSQHPFVVETKVTRTAASAVDPSMLFLIAKGETQQDADWPVAANHDLSVTYDSFNYQLPTAPGSRLRLLKNVIVSIRTQPNEMFAPSTAIAGWSDKASVDGPGGAQAITLSPDTNTAPAQTANYKSASGSPNLWLVPGDEVSATVDQFFFQHSDGVMYTPSMRNKTAKVVIE
jgi:hypothetical protein